jgi:hypothetical protein
MQASILLLFILTGYENPVLTLYIAVATLLSHTYLTVIAVATM